MAAYHAVVTLKHGLLNLVDRFGIWLSKYHPSLLGILQFVVKELKSFQEFVEGLGMKSRMRLKLQLQQATEAALYFLFMFFDSYLKKSVTQPEVMDNQSESESESEQEQRCRDLQELRQLAYSLRDTLKKVEEEYLKVQNEDEAHVDLGGNLVGLSDVYCQLKQAIFSISVEEHVVSLVGMTGIGKTTLAKKLFQDLDVLEWFEHCVWVTIGMRFHPEEITQSILAQMDLDEHDITTEDFLRRNLEDKRYLVVLDDVCDMELCQSYIKSSFPDTEDRSKVLITTRIQDNSLPHHLIQGRLLDKQESWHLLCDKVFAQNSCPIELEKAGKMIAEKCDGLPLTIVTVAKLLSKIPKSLWIQVAIQKKHQLFIDAYDEISEVLRPIYVNLCEKLKSCFLYMGVFPQNYQIPRSKLNNLWIVEKIIEKSSLKTLEDSSIEILQHLAMQSLLWSIKEAPSCLMISLKE